MAYQKIMATTAAVTTPHDDTATRVKMMSRSKGAPSRRAGRFIRPLSTRLPRTEEQFICRHGQRTVFGSDHAGSEPRALDALELVPLGMYWRSSPLVFSLEGRRQRLCGSQKSTWMPVASVKARGELSPCLVPGDGAEELAGQLGHRLAHRGVHLVGLSAVRKVK
jgi:hypothetical protein